MRSPRCTAELAYIVLTCRRKKGCTEPCTYDVQSMRIADKRRVTKRRRYKGFRCDSKGVSHAGSKTQETTPTGGGLLTSDNISGYGKSVETGCNSLLVCSAAVQTSTGVNGSSSRRRRRTPRSISRSRCRISGLWRRTWCVSASCCCWRSYSEGISKSSTL